MKIDQQGNFAGTITGSKNHRCLFDGPVAGYLWDVTGTWGLEKGCHIAQLGERGRGDTVLVELDENGLPSRFYDRESKGKTFLGQSEHSVKRRKTK